MKLKILLLTSLLLSKVLFASQDGYISTYIPISDINRGIVLQKVLFYTYYAYPESAIDSVIWSYKANTPHERYKDREANLAHIKGLKVTLDYRDDNDCEITIDSRNVVSSNETEDIDVILKYVKKATVLNMKNARIKCNITTKKAPKKLTKFFPKALNFSKKDAELFKEYILNKKYPFVSDTIYPLGYSSDGKLFAYIVEHDNDPADFVHIETFVQNLITDKIVWHNEFRTENSRYPADFKSFWKERELIIGKHLTDFKIKPLKNVTLQREKHGFSFDYYTLSSKATKHYEKDWNGMFLTDSIIYIHSQKKGQKIIDKEHYKQGSLVLARKPMGIFPSEENHKRVAVLVGTVRRGWEGPPHNLHYKVIGANLEIGFNK